MSYPKKPKKGEHTKEESFDPEDWFRNRTRRMNHLCPSCGFNSKTQTICPHCKVKMKCLGERRMLRKKGKRKQGKLFKKYKRPNRRKPDA